MTKTRRRFAAALLVPGVGALVVIATQVWALYATPGGSTPPTRFSVVLMLVTLAPYVFIALVMILGRQINWVWWPALIYGIAAAAAGIVLCGTVITGSGSTAALGFVWLPVYLLLGMVPYVAIVALGALPIRRLANRSGSA